MNDDFNTPEALPVIFELAKEVNRIKQSEPEKAAQLAYILVKLGAIIGIAQNDPESFFVGDSDDDDAALIEQLTEQRNTASANKDWASADEARDKLKEMNVILEDSAGKTTWRRG